MIYNCVFKAQFKTAPESQWMIEDLALSAAIYKMNVRPVHAPMLLRKD
jgi:hypothetical protein